MNATQKNDQPAATIEPLLTRKEVGRLLNLKPDAVAVLEKEKRHASGAQQAPRLKAVKFNTRVTRYRPCDVADFIKALADEKRPQPSVNSTVESAEPEVAHA